MILNECRAYLRSKMPLIKMMNDHVIFQKKKIRQEAILELDDKSLSNLIFAVHTKNGSRFLPLHPFLKTYFCGVYFVKPVFVG